MTAVPERAVDTHVHVFEPARYPFAADAHHPIAAEVGTTDDLAAVLDAAGIERVVLVNPTSGYGTDNRCMLDALERLGPRARGIARVPLDCSGRTLDALARRGVVGVRIDFMGSGKAAIADRATPRLLARLADRGMVCAMQGEGAQWIGIAPLVANAPGRIVIDHCGRPDVHAGVDAPAFAAVLRLADTRRVAVKLSGAMRFSAVDPPYADTDPCYDAVIRAFGPTRFIWGSDWPFLRSARRLDCGPALAYLAHLLPSGGPAAGARGHTRAIIRLRARPRCRMNC